MYREWMSREAEHRTDCEGLCSGQTHWTTNSLMVATLQGECQLQYNIPYFSHYKSQFFFIVWPGVRFIIWSDLCVKLLTHYRKISNNSPGYYWSHSRKRLGVYLNPGYLGQAINYFLAKKKKILSSNTSEIGSTFYNVVLFIYLCYSSMALHC